MFKNASEAQAWIEKRKQSFSNISEIQEAGEYFLLVGDTVVKAVVSQVSARKLTFAKSECQIFSEISIFRNKLNNKIVPLELYQDFSQALVENKRLSEIQRKAINITDRLTVSGFKAIKELSHEDQQQLIKMFPDI